MAKGADFAFGRPGEDGAAFAAAGLSFVVRYLNYPGAGGKQLTQAEVDDFHAHGISIVAVFESTGGRALDGFDAGVNDALWAKEAMAALGFPDDRPCYFAIDVDTYQGIYQPIGEYFKGVSSTMGLARTGVYGEYEILVYLQNMRLASWFWQTLAWSGGVPFPDRHIYQYTPGTPFALHLVDYDESYKDDFGQWPVEDDMPDPRIDKIIAALGGEDLIDAWNARGNSLLAGYAIEQADQDKVEAEVAKLSVAALPDHKHVPGGVAPA